jgi:gliding motility-associated-like protein
MVKRTNIDELLKESFENFSPDAPDVWQGIQQSVQATQATTLAVGAKGVALSIKIIAAIAIVGAAITTYILVTNKAENYTPIKVTPVTEKPFENKEHTSTMAVEPTAMEAQQSDRRVTLHSDNPKKDQVKLSLTQEIEPTLATSTPTEFVEKEMSKPVEEIVEINKSQPYSQPTSAAPKTEWEQPSTQGEVQTNPPTKPMAENFDPPIIPGSLSPNNDGLNDRYVIVIENEELFSLVIMDQEGKKVFESNDKTNTWDGRDVKSGNMCPQGTYQYLFKYQFKGAQSPVYKTGFIGLY